MIYGCITEFCTATSCPVMSAGAKYEYLWLDEKTKKPVALPAPDYIGLLMEQIDSKIEDQSLFPASVGVPFPRNYLSEVPTT